MPNLFKSFLQAGFECSTHKLASGKRLDVVSSTHHDRFVKEDYARLGPIGIRTVREGIRWPVIEPRPGERQFASVLPFLQAAREARIEVIWDVLHFGWPDHLEIFTPAWVDAFAELAHDFAELLRTESDRPCYVAPVNEISFFAWGGGDVEYLNPFQRGRGGELKLQLVRAFIAAVNAVRGVLPEVRIVSPEPVIHIAGRADVPGDDVQAEAYRQSMFEAWDMILGRAHPELGGSQRHVDVIGVNFYDRNQWINCGRTLRRGDSEYRPFHLILGEVYERYGLPLFVSETGVEDDERPAWFAYICYELRIALACGVPVHGVCLYPILNHPGWDDDRHCRNGLWDYPSASGEREIYQPLVDEIRRQREKSDGGQSLPL